MVASATVQKVTVPKNIANATAVTGRATKFGGEIMVLCDIHELQDYVYDVAWSKPRMRPIEHHGRPVQLLSECGGTLCYRVSTDVIISVPANANIMPDLIRIDFMLMYYEYPW